MRLSNFSEMRPLTIRPAGAPGIGRMSGQGQMKALPSVVTIQDGKSSRPSSRFSAHSERFPSSSIDDKNRSGVPAA
jgi:hypothetical protein